MACFSSKPEWVDSVEDGDVTCDKCPYKTTKEEHLEEHAKRYHPIVPKEKGKMNYVLYMECSGSLEGRNTLADGVSRPWIDMTGGQAAFHDGELKTFGDELVAVSREFGYKLYCVYRVFDPGLGLDFPMWWVKAGVECGVFQEYELPEDVKPAKSEENESTEIDDE